MSTYALRIRPEAEAELDEAARWYEKQARGLGQEFLRAFRASVAVLRRTPLLYPKVEAEARRLLLRRFPYSVFYEIHGSEVIILSCFHEAREPEEWQQRISPA
ncbi:MAG TPA: type II toxin-antitoxin system RelE/ParE family toxin [Longimicrobiaceae bacterium]|nr:type II toxin-antitoxin system RelE/ParE family toxin [Longimicrobiaceae bacterium]